MSERETSGTSRGGWLGAVFAGSIAAALGGAILSGGVALLNLREGRIDVHNGPRIDLSSWQPAGAALVAVGAALLAAAIVLILVGAHGWGKRTELAPPEMAGGYPGDLTGRLDAPSRALWLVKWLLLLPQAIVFGLLWTAFGVVSVAAWFAILFTGRYPRSFFAFSVGVLRWGWRIAFYGYSALGTDAYPPFSLDPKPYPAELSVAYPERLSRGLVLVKSWLLAIPHLLIVGVLVGAATSDGRGASLLGLLVLVAAVGLLFTGRYLPGVFDFVMGLNRWAFRTLVYVALLRDEYPPFRLDQGPTEPSTVVARTTP